MKAYIPITILFLAATAFAQIPIKDAQTVEGPWEIASASGIDGVFISFNSFLVSQSGQTSISSQAVSLRVYHRANGVERQGYFSPSESSGVNFDLRHLIIHFNGHTDVGPFDIDLRFNPDLPSWTGTWSSDGNSRDVTLERPRFGGPQSRVVGDWNGAASRFAPTTLHIRQSSDGQFIGWLDRSISAFNPVTGKQQTDQRNGELLAIDSVDPSHFKLKTANAAGNQYQYQGVVSDDGKTLTGSWKSELGGRLNAPNDYTRAANSDR